jgi:peroxiredoxin
MLSAIVSGGCAGGHKPLSPGRRYIVLIVGGGTDFPHTRQHEQERLNERRKMKENSHLLGPGTPAPDFTLHSTPDQTVSLSDFRGKPVILAFYPADWSPVCGDQMALYNEILPEFHKHGAELFGISVDGSWCHSAFAAARKLHFPLLSDFEPKGAVARSYGAYRAAEGITERALFVIDAEGIIRWSYCSPVGVNPGADGILEALESLHAVPSEAAR